MGWKQLHARIEECTHMLLFTCQVLACPGNGSACIECFADRFRGAFLCHHQRHGAMHPILVPVVVMCHQVVDIGGAHYCQALVDAPVEGFQVNTEAIDHLDAVECLVPIELIHKVDPFVGALYAWLPSRVVPEDKSILSHSFHHCFPILFVGSILNKTRSIVDINGIEMSGRGVAGDLAPFHKHNITHSGTLFQQLMTTVVGHLHILLVRGVFNMIGDGQCVETLFPCFLVANAWPHETI